MYPDKRGTVESFFLPSNKKSPNDEQQIESNVTISSIVSSSKAQLQNISYSSFSGDQNISDLASDTSSCSLTTLIYLNQSIEAKPISNDITASCNDLPVQPKLINCPINHHKRSFQSSRYSERMWLEYSIKNDACYCYYCCHFCSHKLNNGDASTTIVFNNWKKALGKNRGLTKHASSQTHITATKNYFSCKQREKTNSNVLHKSDSGRVIQIHKNRDRLIKICSTLHLLAPEMISYREHDECERYVNSTYS